MPTFSDLVQRIQDLDSAGPQLRAVLPGTVVDSLSPETIPVLVKDNIDTVELGCSAGSLALEDVPVLSDAPLISKIQAAGYGVLGKTNLSEWANFRSTRSLSGWSSLGGQTKNAYALDRSPSGSSSGSAVAVAAGMAALAIGTETDGSIISPAAHAGIVGIKPTLGFVSRTGIVPIADSQDTAGPMARTVEDAARLLDAMSGYDPEDSATRPWLDRAIRRAVSELARADLQGCRIGYYPGESLFIPEVLSCFEETLVQLSKLGAELVDLSEPMGAIDIQAAGEDELTLLLCEFKEDIERYLRIRRPASRLRTLGDLIEFNDFHSDRVMPIFAQELFERSAATEGRKDPAYGQARARLRQTICSQGLDPLFDRQQICALAMPSNGPAWTRDRANGDRFTGGTSQFAAVSGRPAITLGMGHFRGLPLGVSFLGRAWEDAEIIGIAQVFQRHRDVFQAPRFLEQIEIP